MSNSRLLHSTVSVKGFHQTVEIVIQIIQIMPQVTIKSKQHYVFLSYKSFSLMNQSL